MQISIRVGGNGYIVGLSDEYDLRLPGDEYDLRLPDDVLIEMVTMALHAHRTGIATLGKLDKGPRRTFVQFSLDDLMKFRERIVERNALPSADAIGVEAAMAKIKPSLDAFKKAVPKPRKPFMLDHGA